MSLSEGPVCPVPLSHSRQIMLGHGGGGKLTRDLIARTFLPPLDNPTLRAGDDAGVITLQDGTRIAISTDSHVVWPLFFPGGDIGRLAVCGTVNDVAMLGARPQYLTAGFILEEGLQVDVIERVVASMQTAAAEAGVEIIAGDTKVVQKGKADGMYINTAGFGIVTGERPIGGAQAQPADVVLLSGPVGDHGIAVLAARGDLGFEIDVLSDVAPLNRLVEALLGSGAEVHVLRDPTRGGLAAALNEIACQAEVCIQIAERAVPVRPAVAAACEVLGFDPFYIANEGRLVAIVAPRDADKALAAMRAAPYGAEAVRIGEVLASPPGRVLAKTPLGSTRVVDLPSGELLPRIC